METKKKLKRKVSKHIAAKKTASKSRHSLAFKLSVGIAITLVVLVALIVGGFYYLTHRYYNMLDYVGNKTPDETMAPGATLEPEEEDDDPDMTDSPSDEIAAIDAILNDLLHKYEQEHGITPAPSEEVPGGDDWDETDFDDDPIVIQPTSGNNAVPEESKPIETAVPGPVTPTVKPTKPYYDPYAQGNQGSGLTGGGVGNADMPSVGADPNVTNILLIGIDSRANNNVGRSDTMIVMSINKQTKKIVLTSILRDCYVAIPGRGNNRLNAAHAYGGAGLLMQTIELNFGIHIDYFARVNFYSFIDIVNAAGGVTMTVTDGEVKYINGYMGSLNSTTGGYFSDTLKEDKLPKGGTYLLNGRQALAYARIRYIGTDYARTERQRKVILGVVDRMRHMSFGELDTFLGTALPLISTNLTQDVVNSLVLSVPALLKYDVVQNRIPADGTGTGMRIDGKSVIAVDLIANRNLLNQIVYGR